MEENTPRLKQVLPMVSVRCVEMFFHKEILIPTGHGLFVESVVSGKISRRISESYPAVRCPDYVLGQELSLQKAGTQGGGKGFVSYFFLYFVRPGSWLAGGTQQRALRIHRPEVIT